MGVPLSRLVRRFFMSAQPRLCGVWRVVALTLIAAWSQTAAAGVGDTAGGNDGLAIFQEADRRASGYVDLVVDLQMTLRTRRGASSERDLTIRQLEIPEDGDKTLVVFNTPKTIKGTALLSYAHKIGSDDQWLFLPAVKRVKKIASKNKSGPFLGSEFSYEDLSNQEIEKYTYEKQREEACGALHCFVVARQPVDEYSGYQRQLVWLDDDEYRVQRIEFFDRRGARMKTLTVEGYRQYGERFWKPDRMSMINERTGKSTDLAWRNYRFATGLSDERDFSTNALRRIR